MSRWSLSNKVLPVSQRQFLDLTQEFMDACAQSWRGPVKAEITLYNAPALYTTFLLEPEERAAITAHNDSITLLKTGQLKDITPINWEIAEHAAVTLRPQNPDAAPQHAFAHIEFKGNFNRRATYYIQCSGDEARNTILAKHPLMTTGGGYERHGSQSGAAIAAVGVRSNISSNIIAGILIRGKNIDLKR